MLGNEGENGAKRTVGGGAERSRGGRRKGAISSHRDERKEISSDASTEVESQQQRGREEGNLNLKWNDPITAGGSRCGAVMLSACAVPPT